VSEAQYDPAAYWIQDSQNMDNLIGPLGRPEIPCLGIGTVFFDEKEYLIPQVYGNLLEEEFQQTTLEKLKATTFDLTLMESPIAANPEDHPAGNWFDSTARAYIGFLALRTEKDLVRPEVGARLKVHFYTLGEAREFTAVPDNNASPNDDDELGIEEDYYTREYDDDQAAKSTEWLASVIEPTDVTPKGYLTIILKRPRKPGFRGPRQNRPFVRVALPTVNFRAAHSARRLAQLIKRGPATSVKISVQYTRQGFKDQVRCASALWSSNEPQKQRLRQGLLCHDTQNTPFNRVNLLALKGSSSLDLTGKFNPVQRATYDSLSSTPEITLLHGPFGTGKTTFLMSTALEIISNPTVRHQILYLVESNLAVDDVAMRLATLACTSGLGHKKVVRLHTVNSEKTEAYRYYDAPPQARHSFQASDEFVAEFAMLGYLTNITSGYQEARARGDPRRVLHDMSLAAAIHRTLESTDNPSLLDLRAMLQEYGRFHNSDPVIRTQIKLGLSALLALTIQDTDVIVCTVAASAKVDVATNFRPVVVYLDEAARVSELKSLIPLGSYGPLAFILAGDHKQTQPTVSSASGLTNRCSRFPNPFEGQVLLSLFERLIIAGHDHHMLKMQHRCMGDIPAWVSRVFYHGQVMKSPVSSADNKLLATVRQFG
jgi:hypothetical protein